jgi:predicted lipid-binding transport protein (Tim44 family)
VTGIIIFALAAVFLGLRLYAVLGKRTGHEQGFTTPEETTVPAIGSPKAADDRRERPQSLDLGEPVETNEAALKGLRAIAAADRGFSPEEFVEGATHAYGMVLKAYWAGDLSPVEGFVAEDVRDAFADAIESRSAAGQTLDNRLIAVERAVISSAELDKGVATITVRFDADIAAVTRDMAGTVIAGSVTDAVPTHDAWTFSREIKSRDPNWILTDTDEAS